MNAQRKYLHDASHATVAVVAEDAQEIAAISADYHQASGSRRDKLLAVISDKVDALLSRMLLDFGGHPTAREVNELLAEHHPLTETRLGKLPAHSVPLIVMRELISVHQTPIDRSQLQNWSLFKMRYGPAVV